MAEKDLLEIIARMTANTITTVSRTYYKQNPEADRPQQEKAVSDKSGGGFPFGTSFPDTSNITNTAQSYTKSLNSLFRKRYGEKEN